MSANSDVRTKRIWRATCSASLSCAPEVSVFKISEGPAPVRAYIEELLPDMREGRIEPGFVFDRIIGIEGVPDGYRAMDQRDRSR
jgi:hypothetical protein